MRRDLNLSKHNLMKGREEIRLFCSLSFQDKENDSLEDGRFLSIVPFLA